MISAIDGGPAIHDLASSHFQVSASPAQRNKREDDEIVLLGGTP